MRILELGDVCPKFQDFRRIMVADQGIQDAEGGYLGNGLLCKLVLYSVVCVVTGYK